MTPAARTGLQRPERWLAAARVALLLLAALTIGLYLASVPLKLAELRQLCVDLAQCGSQLSPAQATQLLAAGLSLDFYAGYFVLTRLAHALVFWSIALLILWRRSSDRMALLTALLLVIFPTNGAGVVKVLPPAYPALWFPVQLVQYTAWQIFPIFFLLFPTGRWVPRLRYTGWFLVVWATSFIPGYFFPAAPIANLPDSLGFIFFPAMFGMCLLGQVYRYRRVSTAVERQQTKWVVYGVALVLGSAIAGPVAITLLAPSISLTPPLAPADFVADSILNSLFLILPVTLAVSILRYRLFDIDLLIRRTLVYSTLTAVLAVMYFGSVLMLERLLRGVTGGRSTLIIVLSTLAIAVLVVPLRRYVQTVIDQRFFRRKYDAARTLAGFAASARDETDLARLSTQLVRVVDETMQPESVSLWLKPAARREGRP
jgi:hypothetical protein